MSNHALLIKHPFAGCALRTLNRPQAMNALSQALRLKYPIQAERSPATGHGFQYSNAACRRRSGYHQRHAPSGVARILFRDRRLPAA